MIQINLLPKEYRKRATPFHFDKKLLYSGAAIVVVFLLLSSLTIYKKQMIRELDNKISSIQRQRNSLDKDIKLIDDLTDLKQKLLTRMAAIEQLDKNRGMWVRILEELSARVPEMLWLTKVEEERPKQDKQEKRAPKSGKGQKEAADDSTLTEQQPRQRLTNIEGYAYTLNSIASFFANLTKSGYFNNLELAFARQEELQEVVAYNFRIKCLIDYDAWLKDAYQPENTMPSPLAEQ